MGYCILEGDGLLISPQPTEQFKKLFDKIDQDIFTMEYTTLDFGFETRTDVIDLINEIVPFFKRYGYNLNGTIHYKGEYDDENMGYIDIINNKINHYKGVTIYVPEKYANIVPRVVKTYMEEPLKDLIDVYIKNKEK